MEIFLHITSASSQTNTVTLKRRAAYSSKKSEHLTTTECRNPEEGHNLNKVKDFEIRYL
jgi:hypothetical protein